MTDAQTQTQTRVGLPPRGDYEIDPVHTGVSFVSKHMMLARVRGRFGVFSGTIHIDEQPERSWVEVEIDASSIDTNMPMRDDHLRSGDFLDLENHPTMVFKSTALQIRGERTFTRTFTLRGDLTIRGSTLPVDLDVVYEGINVGLQGETRVGFTATGEIDREAYGMTWNQALESGGVLVGKKVKIELDIQAIRNNGGS